MKMPKNWKTTLAGLGGAFLNMYANGATVKTAGVSVALGLVGMLSKDHDVTGGERKAD